MATKDLWQFRSVIDFGLSTIPSHSLGSDCVITLESRPEVETYSLPDGFGGTLQPKAGDVVLTFGLPDDLPNYALNGTVRVICSTNEFPRDAGVFDATKVTYTDQEFNLDLAVRNQVIYRCLIPCVPSTTVYVSVFYYSAANTVWITSPNHLMDRFVSRGSSGFWGLKHFDLLPRHTRKLDSDNADTLSRLFHLFGTSLDDLQSLMDYVAQSVYDPESVDAGKLPYIDRLLGWPTNFELKEVTRRQETAQAVSLWKAKGSARALDLVMQNTIGWAVDIFEGMDQVFRLNTATR